MQSAKLGLFEKWLRRERDYRLDELSSDSRRKYFRKFVRVSTIALRSGRKLTSQRWNEGELRERYYRSEPTERQPRER